jgi:hypothetical protein
VKYPEVLAVCRSFPLTTDKSGKACTFAKRTPNVGATVGLDDTLDAPKDT